MSSSLTESKFVLTRCGDDLCSITGASPGQAQSLASQLRDTGGWLEVIPGLDSVLVRFDAARLDGADAHGEIEAVLAAGITEIEAPADLLDRLKGRPIFRCWLEPTEPVTPFRVISFCAIGAPKRFFNALARAEFDVAAAFEFPDHHVFSDSELAHLENQAAQKDGRLITTRKDYVRLPQALRDRVHVFDVAMTLERPEAMQAFVLDALNMPAPNNTRPDREPGNDRR